MNAAQPLGPGSAEKFLQYRFRLVIESMRGGHGVRLAAGHQLPEKCIAKVAGGLLQGLMERRGRGRSVRAMQVEWEVMGRGQAGYKGSVLVGSGSANAVMHVGDGKHDAQLAAFLEHAGAAGPRSRRPRKRRRQSAGRGERDWFGELAQAPASLRTC